jgi:desulfoferrodoxin (superoxide reductase-like protein)
MRDIELGEVGPANLRPESANVSDIPAGQSQAAPLDGLMRRHGHEPSRISSDNTSRMDETPSHFDVISYFGSQREGQGYNNFAFLLWGSADSLRGETWAVDVPLTDLGAEEKAMKRLMARYNEARGLLGSCFYLREGVHMEPVKVGYVPKTNGNAHFLTWRMLQFRLVYREGDKFRAYITGPMPVKVEQASIRAMLEETTAQFLKTLRAQNQGVDDEDAVCCEVYNQAEDDSHEEWCPVIDLRKEGDTLDARLQWWETIGSISLFFRDPKSLRGQKVLLGPSHSDSSLGCTPEVREYSETLIYSYQ